MLPCEGSADDGHDPPGGGRGLDSVAASGAAAHVHADLRRGRGHQIVKVKPDLAQVCKENVTVKILKESVKNIFDSLSQTLSKL